MWEKVFLLLAEAEHLAEKEGRSGVLGFFFMLLNAWLVGTLNDQVKKILNLSINSVNLTM